MTYKSGALYLGLVSAAAFLAAAFILFVVFPWAERRPDPDAIEAPAWFVVIFLVVVGVALGATSLFFVAHHARSRFN